MAKEWIVPDADLGCDGAYFDYQELVRCKGCIWRLGTDCTRFAEIPITLDDYCSRGKKKLDAVKFISTVKKILEEIE